MSRPPAHLQALAAPAGSAPVLSGVAALTRIAVLYANYACLDVVPAHIVYGAFTGIEDEGQSRGVDWRKPTTYVTWRHIVEQAGREDECWRARLVMIGEKGVGRGGYIGVVWWPGEFLFGIVFVRRGLKEKAIQLALPPGCLQRAQRAAKSPGLKPTARTSQRSHPPFG